LFGYAQDHLVILLMLPIAQLDLVITLIAAPAGAACQWQAAFQQRTDLPALMLVALRKLNLARTTERLNRSHTSLPRKPQGGIVAQPRQLLDVHGSLLSLARHPRLSRPAQLPPVRYWQRQTGARQCPQSAWQSL